MATQLEHIRWRLAQPTARPYKSLASEAGVSRKWLYSLLSGECNPGLQRLERLRAALDKREGCS
jgi:transcriptional regulator with XRE-family HTH domain